ncbi:hypothetical protein LMG29542_01458 [Paraburkholderia humisilvae]|uniref:Uncharacterized protein n=1 Tax=Paraburkholderia humisilvae TaxID=627669 RepID=A0A6J5DBI7_9BURK|nr:hypothetical protein LMG29542_01458 [Paraburkholderia humisilvae]
MPGQPEGQTQTDNRRSAHVPVVAAAVGIGTIRAGMAHMANSGFGGGSKQYFNSMLGAILNRRAFANAPGLLKAASVASIGAGFAVMHALGPVGHAKAAFQDLTSSRQRNSKS